jgi:hypothetical protein
MNENDSPLAILCDLDGTLAHLNGRNPYDASTCTEDTLNEPVAHIVRTYAAAGVKVILVSGREERFRKPTEHWLAEHRIAYEALLMRRTRDFRKDAIIKTEIYRARIEGTFRVLFVLDDRNQVVDQWRTLGLTCLQVAPGDF